jgi:hypothetical protein
MGRRLPSEWVCLAYGLLLGLPRKLRTCGGMNLARYSVGREPWNCREGIFASERLDEEPGKGRLPLILA